MKWMQLLLCLIFFATQVFGEEATLIQMRILFREGANSRTACKQLLEACDKMNKRSNATFLGYIGCANMMMAKYGFNPVTKFNSFTYGKSLLEQAIHEDAKNIELIFLRFVIQLNCPLLLNYNDDLKADKSAILMALPHIKDLGLGSFIRNYLLQSDQLTITEKTAL